jgi:SM-20-related protein
LQNDFDTLIDSYIKNKVGIDNHFLSKELASMLKVNLLRLTATKQLKDAGIGNKTSIIDKKLRGDEIFWLDKAHDDKTENKFFKLIDDFIVYLNSTCYTGITSYEFHYTMYSAGTFYKKHFDQFQNNSDRAFSMIIYLNPDWELVDGGELCLHEHNSIQTISPNNRKCVFFKSDEMEHEVLITNEPRYSITGWLKVGGKNNRLLQ